MKIVLTSRVYFKYLDTLVEKVKLLSQEVIKKNKALVSAQAFLSKLEAILEEANWSLDPSHKRIKDL